MDITIPNSVKADTTLKANEKLLYGEIFTRAKTGGYCTLCNRDFAKIYGMNIVTISHLISALVKKDLIINEVIRGQAGQVIERRLYIR